MACRLASDAAARPHREGWEQRGVIDVEPELPARGTDDLHVAAGRGRRNLARTLASHAKLLTVSTRPGLNTITGNRGGRKSTPSRSLPSLTESPGTVISRRTVWISACVPTAKRRGDQDGGAGCCCLDLSHSDLLRRHRDELPVEARAVPAHKIQDDAGNQVSLVVPIPEENDPQGRLLVGEHPVTEIAVLRKHYAVQPPRQRRDLAVGKPGLSSRTDAMRNPAKRRPRMRRPSTLSSARRSTDNGFLVGHHIGAV